jgi:hypothetical protein
MFLDKNLYGSFSIYQFGYYQLISCYCYWRCNSFITSFFFFFVVLGFELGASHLLGRCSTAWASLPTLFAMVNLEMGSHFLPRLAWTVVLLFWASCHSWDDRRLPPHPALFCWDRVSKLLSELDWNLDSLNLSFLRLQVWATVTGFPTFFFFGLDTSKI